VEKSVQFLPILKLLVPVAFFLTHAFSHAGDEFRPVVMFKFKDRASLESYLPHPAHVAFKESSLPVIEKLMVLDYTAKD
jgi:hypothetical protein